MIAPADTRSLRLLLVEDEALVAMMIEDVLALHGHAVVGVADTAAEAMRIAAADKPDMVLCDIQLAEGPDGVRVAEALAGQGVICLYLSGHCPERVGHRLIVGCLAKPFHTASLGLAIQTAIEAAAGRRPERLPPGMTLY